LSTVDTGDKRRGEKRCSTWGLVSNAQPDSKKDDIPTQVHRYHCPRGWAPNENFPFGSSLGGCRRTHANGKRGNVYQIHR
jgi:hypothetical protein